LATLTLVSKSALADDGCKDPNDPESCFDGFDDDDNIKTDDGKAEKTFAFPPIKAGFIVDFHHKDIAPILSLELLSFSDFAIDVGVAQSRVFVTFDWVMIPIVKIGPFLWAGYNVPMNDFAGGLGVAILDF